MTALTNSLRLEYESVCKRHATACGVTLQPVDDYVTDITNSCQLFAVYLTLRPTLSDPGDDLVLEAAVAGSVDWIVTHNRRDFATTLAAWSFDIITPGEMVRRMGLTP